MLARRRRRHQEKKHQHSIDLAARNLVDQELQIWRKRVLEAKKETEMKRMHYQHQEEELLRLYEKSCIQLEQRRATLLVATSLIPYTHTIQAASNFRVPAVLLTLQAKLCLHVHCLCVHEELLLKSKEQGWDTIAWMEDVTRQLRLLTQKQMSLLQIKMEKEVANLRRMKQGIEIPHSVLHTLQMQGTHEGEDADTSAAAIPLTFDLPKPQGYPCREHSPSKEESFLEFLQRYEQRKAHQQRADQMRLAEFRSRSGASTENPYSNRRAAIGNKLKNYASRLFQGKGGMDDSLHVQDFEGSPTSPTTVDNSPATVNVPTPTGRQSWIPFGRQRSSPVVFSQSESTLDTTWSLGSSLRGLRKRESPKVSGHTDMETQAEVKESRTSGHGEDDNQNRNEENDAGGDDIAKPTSSAGFNEVDVSASDGPAGTRYGRMHAASTPTSSLKNKLKAPVIHKLSESARW